MYLLLRLLQCCQRSERRTATAAIANLGFALPRVDSHPPLVSQVVWCLVLQAVYDVLAQNWEELEATADG